MSVREMTNRLIDMADEGVISWESVALSCLRYMSESDVADMARCELDITADDDGDICPSCGDTMDSGQHNMRPTWSDRHGDTVCWWCANNPSDAEQDETGI